MYPNQIKEKNPVIYKKELCIPRDVVFSSPGPTGAAALK